MVLFYITVAYVIGLFMMHDSLKTNKHILIVDVVMFLLSPFTMLNFLILKIISHFFDLEEVVYKQKK